jgi:hypothetical protein
MAKARVFQLRPSAFKVASRQPEKCILAKLISEFRASLKRIPYPLAPSLVTNRIPEVDRSPKVAEA